MTMTEAEVLKALQGAGAILSGHFELTSGRHSDTYVQCARVLEDTALTTRLARELAVRLEGTRPDLVVAPAIGGIVIGFAVAQAIGVPFIFTERVGGEMTMRRSFEVPTDARVLVVEDVVTTGGSVGEVVDLVKVAGGVVVGVASIIDRGVEKVFDAPLTALVSLEVDSWEPEECALCAGGEPTTSPGSRRVR